MKKIIISIAIVILSLGVTSAQKRQSAPPTTTFSYQGKLTNSSAPANGIYDFKFILCDSAPCDNILANTTADLVQVTAGIFTVSIDFGENVYNGSDRFIGIFVKLHGSPDNYTELFPRQKLGIAPKAAHALNADVASFAGTAQTANNASSLGGVTANNYLQKNGDASQLTNINGSGIASGTVTSTQLSQEAIPNSSAYKLLGSLRWDLLKPQASFPVGSSPRGVAFDGANIWVTNNGSNNVTKLRASDGANLGTFPVGVSPNGVAFDGANVWVANSDSDNVTKLRASDGANLGTFPVGNLPWGVAFDGANIWVTKAAIDDVTKLRASDGANLGTFPVGSSPRGIAFDGANMWVANAGSSNITKLQASDGANLGSFVLGNNPSEVAFDGANIWVTGFDSNNVTKLRASDGANLGTFPVGNDPIGVAFDGANIWVANSSTISNRITKLRASDGANLGTFPVGSSPTRVAFDGANIWVTNRGSGTVTRMQPAFPQQ